MPYEPLLAAAVVSGADAIRFPYGFLSGAASAAHQVEGGNVACDIWVLEHLPNTVFREPTGDACDFYHRYADDVATVAALGLNAFASGLSGRGSGPIGARCRRRCFARARG